jgi:6-phosphogluconolactonase
MKQQTFVMALCLGFAALAAHAKEATSSLVYIGTRSGTPPAGEAQTQRPPQGVYAARFDSKTGKLAMIGIQVELENAAWLVANPNLPVIYSLANAEGGLAVNSNMYSFAVDTASGKLRELNRVDSGGRDTTYLHLDAKSNTLFGASFASGDVTAVPVLSDGKLDPVASSQKEYGTGPHPRQSSPHAHSVAIDPTHRYVISADMGADRIFVYRFDGKTRTLTPAATPFEQSPPGSGPRHLVFHPNGKFLYVNTELSAEVRAYRWDAKQERLHLVEALPAYPAGYTGNARSSAEIGLSRDGRFLYVTLRGDQDSIVVYDVNKTTGVLKEIQRIAAQGKSPRSFAFDPTGRWMLVANDVSNSVVVFSVDLSTGKLSATGESMSIPSPAALTFYSN